MDEYEPTVKCTEETAGFETEGCLAKLTTAIKRNINTIGGVGIGVAFIQVRLRFFLFFLLFCLIPSF
jgi:hypothetical protein